MLRLGTSRPASGVPQVEKKVRKPLASSNLHQSWKYSFTLFSEHGGRLAKEEETTTTGRKICPGGEEGKDSKLVLHAFFNTFVCFQSRGRLVEEVEVDGRKSSTRWRR